MKNIQSYLGRFFLYFFIILIPLSVIGYMYYNSRVQRYLITIKKEQEKEVELRIGRMVEYFRFVDSELKTIVNMDQVESFFEGSSGQQQLAEDFLISQFTGLMKYTNMYDQIRLLDIFGMERIRLNYDDNMPQLVSAEDLQFKGNRDFFKESIHLAKNEIYLSRFDLNEENGQIETPIVPVIRIATPIKNNALHTKGVLVFNLKGDLFLQSLRDMGKDRGWETFMLNEDGYYLTGTEPMKNWAFQLHKDEDYTFKKDYPKIDQLMRSTDKATVSTSKGIFTFCMISEYNFKKAEVNVNQISETWYIVSHLPQAQLQQQIAALFDFKDIFLLVFGVFFSILLAFLFANMVVRRKTYEKQLIASGHDLEVASRMKDKFISILAHDLKNPLASVTGFVDILRDDFVNMPADSRHRIVTAMENSTKTLIRLIDDVLIWARNQNNTGVQDPEIIFVNKIVDDAVKFSHMQASRKEVTLEVKLDGEYFALADPQMIETVLRNLISNAIKFSRRQSSIKIAVEKYHQKYLVVSVADSGIGIKEKVRKELFSLDGFQTTPGTENEKGTGMGLIICKDFVNSNNGSIWVESKEGVGSTFKFTLLCYDE